MTDQIVIDAEAVGSITRVVASVADRSVEMKQLFGDYYHGSLSLAGAPKGPVTLAVTATEENGNKWQQKITLIYGAPPVITINSPQNYDVARPTVHFSVGCSHEDPSECQTYKVMEYNGLDSVVLSEGAFPLERDIDLSAFDGSAATIYVQVYGSVGQSTYKQLLLFVESNPRFRPEETVNGIVRNAGPDFILYADNPYVPQYFLRDRVTQLDAPLADPGPYLPNDGTVAPNGDVVFSKQTGPDEVFQIFRTRNGETTQLTHDTDRWNKNPITDGVNVVYAKQIPCCIETPSPQYGIAMLDANGREEILSPIDQNTELLPQLNYQVNNGWVAYSTGTGHVLGQIWVRSSEGGRKMMSGGIDLRALGPNGEVVYRNPSPPTRSDSSPYSYSFGSFYREDQFDVGGLEDGYFWQEGKLHAFLGNTVFAVDTDPCFGRAKGDPNGDGTVDVSDAVIVLQTIVGLVTPPDACAQSSVDVNCDGEVTIADAVLVLRNIVLGEPFPACTGG